MVPIVFGYKTFENTQPTFHLPLFLGDLYVLSFWGVAGSRSDPYLSPMIICWLLLAAFEISFNWLVVDLPPLKNISQWQGLSHILWKILENKTCSKPPTSLGFDVSPLKRLGSGVRRVSKNNSMTLCYGSHDSFADDSPTKTGYCQ